MNNELHEILKIIEKERGISREAMLKTIEGALTQAASKSIFTSGDVRVNIDRQTLEMKAFQKRVVTEEGNGKAYISLADARKVKPDAEIGDLIETPVEMRVFGRIAAAAAKQAIQSGIRDNEREIMMAKYAKSVGRIVTATVRQISRKDILCSIGDGEAILKARDKMRSDRFQPGSEFRAVIRFVGMEKDLRDEEKGAARGSADGHRNEKYVDENHNNPCVKLSRTDPMFVEALFREQSTELKDETVEIVKIARQPGIRTKMVVRSKGENVDPVGACVGVRGSRIRPVINELDGEKIDIVPWSADTARFVMSALSPAVVSRVELNEKTHTAIAYVERGAMTSVIGKSGVNTRLAAELVGWDISIRELTEDGETEEEKRAREEKFRRDYEQKVAVFAASLGVSLETADALASHGFLTLEGIIAMTRTEFIAEMVDDRDGSVPAFAAEDAVVLWETATQTVLNRPIS